MPYCSLEEAWGSDFKDANYFAKLNSGSSQLPPKAPDPLQPPSNPSPIQSQLPPKQEKSNLDAYFPSYSGGIPSIPHIQKMKSNIVPYEVNFPNQSRRNYLFPIDQNTPKDDDNDSALELLEDNDHDIRHLDKQRNLIPEYDYMDSEDYFLYKKYLNLAEKYKKKLRRKFKNFVEETGSNILENFSNQSPQSHPSYSFKDIIILIIVGIFLIFTLDIFTKISPKPKHI